MYDYPFGELIGDYSRAALGFVLTLAPMTQLPVGSISFNVLLVLTLLFAWLGWHTWRRHRSRIVMDEQQIRLHPSGPRIVWKELTRVDLSYFSTRADRRHGWMQLTLWSNDQKLRVDSRLNGFNEIVRFSGGYASRLQLHLDSVTVSNFEALGVPDLGLQTQPAEESACR